MHQIILSSSIDLENLSGFYCIAIHTIERFGFIAYLKMICRKSNVQWNHYLENICYLLLIN